MKKILIFIFTALFFITDPSFADVTTDGTMGTRTTLSGPDYTISEAYGERYGENLYHSFSTFNIGNGETATFTATTETSNIISRITGGNPSRIDGSLQCSIPDANIWLLNSSGLIFGKNASINVDGSFYASTADYIRMTNSEIFYTDPDMHSILSYEAPYTFGFLDNSNGDIIFEGRGSGSAGVKVGAENEIFICGGNISVSGSSDDAGELNPNFSAPSGRVTLNAAQHKSEININERFIHENIGTVELNENALININGEFDGEVFIRAGKFYMNNSTISAGSPEIPVSSELEGFDASVNIVAPNISIENNSLIESAAKGDKNAGNITIQNCNTFTLTGGSKLSTSTAGNGNAGAIEINAEQTIIDDNSTISSSSTGQGSAGFININSDEIRLINNSTIASSRNFNNSFGLAGEIILNAGEKLLIDNSMIKTESTYAGGGWIIMNGKIVSISDSNISTEVKSGFNKGGNIYINSKLLILNRATLNAKAYEGNGGDIFISATNMMKSANSTITASSKFGFSGFIAVDAPASEIPSGFSIFNTELPDLEQWAVTPCNMRSGAEVSSFFITNDQLVIKDYSKWYQNHLFHQKNEN